MDRNMEVTPEVELRISQKQDFLITKRVIRSMKNEYSGFTGYGKVYTPGDNHPTVG